MHWCFRLPPRPPPPAPHTHIELLAARLQPPYRSKAQTSQPEPGDWGCYDGLTQPISALLLGHHWLVRLHRFPVYVSGMRVLEARCLVCPPPKLSLVSPPLLFPHVKVMMMYVGNYIVPIRGISKLCAQIIISIYYVNNDLKCLKVLMRGEHLKEIHWIFFIFQITISYLFLKIVFPYNKLKL